MSEERGLLRGIRECYP